MRVAIVAVAFCLVPAVGVPKSLGDAARDAARKRAGEALPARTYSEADLPPSGTLQVPDASAPVPGKTATAQPGPDRKPTPEEAVRAQLEREEQARAEQEARWRSAARSALAEIEQAQSELEDCRLHGG